MIKSEILDAIREAAAKNGGIPLGQGRFTKETGIQTHIWRGKFWLRWSDAVTEAGFSPNTLTAAYGDEFLLTKLAELARTRGHVPIDTELRFAKSNDESFPGVEAFYRLGSKAERTELLRAFLSQKPEFADVLAILPPQSVIEGSAAEEVSVDDDVVGFVYMMRLGKHFKIGHTTAVPRRHREIALELPEAPSVVHHIRTDDPDGIERYWHARFARFRANGEWFALTQKEVRIFKRRKTM